jgi:hypothetical protein
LKSSDRINDLKSLVALINKVSGCRQKEKMAGYTEGDEENLFRANKIQRFATTPT